MDILLIGIAGGTGSGKTTDKIRESEALKKSGKDSFEKKSLITIQLIIIFLIFADDLNYLVKIHLHNQ
jgi:hypothetical protein